MSPELPDPSGTRAVLVGVAEYQRLEAVPAVRANLAALRGIFTDIDHWALPATNCVVLDAPVNSDQVLDALQHAADEATDTLLFYFAGHGLLDDLDDDELQLALPLADPAHPHRAGVAYRQVRRSMLAAGARRGIVVLDCCYSGQALKRWMSDGDAALAGLVDIDGCCVITASANNRRALAPPGEEHTAFTGELIRVLREGVTDGPELLSIDELFRRAELRLRAKDRPVPRRGAVGYADRLPIARNVAHPTFLRRQIQRLTAERDALRLRPAEVVVKTTDELQGWAIGDPGRAFTDVVPELSDLPVPDTVLDGARVCDLLVRAASVRGLMHRYRNQVRQDAYALAASADRRWLVAAVADGVHDCPLSHLGAEAATRIATQLLIHLLDDETPLDRIDVEQVVSSINARLTDLALEQPRAADGNTFSVLATTLLVVICATGHSDGMRDVAVLSVGDGSVYALSDDLGWSPLLVPADDEGLVSGRVSALPVPGVPRTKWDRLQLPAPSAVFAMTDGVGDPMHAAMAVRDALAQAWAVPPSLLKFAEQVGFARKGHMDDRTVIGIWPV